MHERLATETRKLAAIMFTDIVGFSRQMGTDEARMLRLLEVHNQIVQQAVTAHHGHVIKTIGDAFLVDFPSVVHAVQCAQSIQAQLRAHNAEKEKAEQIHVRIGIHLGDIVQRDGDVFGDGVNIAVPAAKSQPSQTRPASRTWSIGMWPRSWTWDSSATRQAQAQEHCRTLCGLCPTPEAPNGVRQTTASPTLQTFPSGTLRCTG